MKNDEIRQETLREVRDELQERIDRATERGSFGPYVDDVMKWFDKGGRFEVKGIQ